MARALGLPGRGQDRGHGPARPLPREAVRRRARDQRRVRVAARAERLAVTVLAMGAAPLWGARGPRAGHRDDGNLEVGAQRASFLWIQFLLAERRGLVRTRPLAAAA